MFWMTKGAFAGLELLPLLKTVDPNANRKTFKIMNDFEMNR